MTLYLPGTRRKLKNQHVTPFKDLPLETQAHVEATLAACGDSPPDKWFKVGSPDDHRPMALIMSRAWYEWHVRRGIDPDRSRPPISPYVRRKVLERDGHVCHICKGEVAPGDVHLDHVIPHSKGGPTTISNLRVAHSVCNIRKGNRHEARA